MTTAERLEQIFRSTFGDETIVLRDDMTADDVEDWDSVMHVTLILTIEDEFRITLATADLENMKTVGDLKGAIERQL